MEISSATGPRQAERERETDRERERGATERATERQRENKRHQMKKKESERTRWSEHAVAYSRRSYNNPSSTDLYNTRQLLVDTKHATRNHLDTSLNPKPEITWTLP